MGFEGKFALIDRLITGYSCIEKLISGIGPEELKFVPSVQDAWSINDFLVHFLDADLSLAFRVRTAIAEPGKAVPVWEEEDWHDTLHYNVEDGLSCLYLAKSIRSFIGRGLSSIVEDDWSGYFIIHPSKGRMDLAALIEIYDQHVIFHCPLIKRNRQAWHK